MPRNTDPSTIRTGPGQTVPDLGDRLVLIGGGMVGAGPNVGQVGHIPPDGAYGDAKAGFPPLSPNFGGSAAAMEGVYTHVHDPKGAHPASAISIDGHPDLFIADHVEGALDELMGTIPPQPAMLGYPAETTWMSGVSDWGVLKLSDSSFVARGILTTTVAPGDVYPYYWVAPSPALDTEFSDPGQGGDPETDHVFNSDLAEAALPGAGFGLVFAGGFTRDGAAPSDQPVMRTDRIMYRTGDVDGVTGLPKRRETTFSGMLFPADRGVLALIHWPAGTAGSIGSGSVGSSIGAGDAPTIQDFLDQPLLTRCVAAILCGQGIIGDQCFTTESPTPHLCDGNPGGIFAFGTDENGDYDPFVYPARASGQYNLREIVAGVSSIDGTPLAPPFDDLNGDGNPGHRRVRDSEIPGPGQVRLGTDPGANDAGNHAPVQSYGIPVLGANDSMYFPLPPSFVDAEIGGNTRVVGDSALLDSNFFRYRVPYLKDYSTATGLKYTPRGANVLTSKETARYFDIAVPGVFSAGANFTQAGDFQDFGEDYWIWQICRYRHTFLLPSTAPVAERNEVGTYWMLHFQREQDFEAFVRDGVLPDHVTEGYELYGASVVFTGNIEVDGNVVNVETDPTVPAPAGPAPAYGYAADSYHVLRSTVLQDPRANNAPVTSNTTWVWDSDSVPGNEALVRTSGVAYFISRNPVTGVSAFHIDDVTFASGNFWDAGYRTHDEELTGGAVAPALLSSPNTAFIGTALFLYGAALNYPLGNTPLDCVRRHRVEFPFSSLGGNAGGAFSNANGPADTDPLVYNQTGVAHLTGDDEDCAFCTDVRPRVFLRKPTGHLTMDTRAYPFVADEGHGSRLTQVVPTPGTLLFHSTGFNAANPVAEFGNFRDGGTGQGYPSLFTSEKDYTESFLDETYRYREPWHADIDVEYGVGARAALVGPGMGARIPAPIEVPVRAGATLLNGFDDSSYLQQLHHETSLAALTEELQVAGLPERNPPISNGVNAPFPPTGMVRYPHVNYAAGHRPVSPLDMAAVNPNYSALTGTRSYVRTFDAGWSRSPEALDGAGRPYMLMRITGLSFDTFSYSAPGPGGLVRTGIAVFVKVPGLTTWMDVGRPDGGGPSKQDIGADGAGCLVGTPVEGIVSGSGMVYTDLVLHVGPEVNLFRSVQAEVAGEIPVLVKVVMAPDGADYDLTERYSGAGVFVPGVRPGLPWDEVQGLMSIRLQVYDVLGS